MSITSDVVDAWLARTRGMKCTSGEAARMCKGDRVYYRDPRTRTFEEVTITHVAPLTPLLGGGSEPASVTVMFGDGRERNTFVANLTTSPPPAAAP
jgi:hypothetical protein